MKLKSDLIQSHVKKKRDTILRPQILKKSSHICLLARDKAEVLKNLHYGQPHHQESKSHANTVPWPWSKG